MRNLDFKKNGLQELSNQEMSELEGGAIFKLSGLFEWAFGGSSWDNVQIEILGWEIK